MLSWVREGINDVYCECIMEKDGDNMNLMEENMVDKAHMEGENSVLGRDGNDGSDGEYFLEYESLWNSSDYDIVVSDDDDKFEKAVKSKRRSRVEVQKEILNQRKDNASVG